MRIVGGELRGRSLAAPKSDLIRPTADRIRESLFGIISSSYGHELANARVLDLFAGTGALGIEALSRGADFALFVENSIEGRGLLRQNIEVLGLQGRTKLFRRDATRLGKLEAIRPFDMVFADPPYGENLGEKAAASALEGGWLTPGALMFLEEDKRHAPQNIDGFQLLEQRNYKITTIGIYRRV